MLKKTIRRLGALAMVLAMAVSVFAVNASAVEETEPVAKTPVSEITKEISKGTHTYVPDATFSFSVSNDGASDGVTNPHTANNEVVTIDSVDFDPASSDIGVTSVTKKAEIHVDWSKLTQPGIYYFTVTENKSNVAGVTDSTASKILAVYKYSDSEKNTFLFLNSDKTDKEDGTFTNTYVNTADLTITKTVTGDFGDKTKDFTFTLKINNVVAANRELKKGNNVITTNEKGEFTLKNGESVIVTGLEAADTYEVVETTAAGYTTKVGTEVTNTATGNMTKSETELTSGNKTAAYTNNCDASPVTGVIMTIAPYALMVVLAGAFAVVFLTRRNRAE